MISLDYEALTKGKLIELMKDAPNDTVINIMYKEKGYTANIEVLCELGAGATNQRNIIFLDAKKPSYLK
jgi:hypothetical protein